MYVKFSRPEAVGLSVNKNGMGDSKYNKLMAELKASVECPVCLNVPTDGSHMLTCPRLSFCFLFILLVYASYCGFSHFVCFGVYTGCFLNCSALTMPKLPDPKEILTLRTFLMGFTM